MPTRRQEIFKAIYTDLSTHNSEEIVLAADEIDPLAGESVMQEEARALPAFFKPGDGIYARLLAKHPDFAKPEKAKKGEDGAITDRLKTIEARLSRAKDRTKNDELVGTEAAKAAITNPTKRWRREYSLGSERTFDEIGQLHSALRLILDDNSIKAGTSWTTRYFNQRSGFQGQTYRHYLALIWKGATEQDIEAPITYAGTPSEELRESAITQIISSLAQCRREHNFDGNHPDWDQTKAPQDAQRCDIGLRGDLFGQMLIHNEYYMQTRSHLNVELLEPIIKDALFEEFTKLDITTKTKIVAYMESKSSLDDPSDEDVAAKDEFISTMKLKLDKIILEKIYSVGPDSPLYKIQQYMLKATEKSIDGNEEAAKAMNRVFDNLHALIELEADSLNLTERTNTASLDYIRRFMIDGISQVYQGRLTAALNNDKEAQQNLINQHLNLFKKVEGLGYLVENDLMRTSLFTEAQLSAEKKLRYTQLNEQYAQTLNIMEEQIAGMIQQYANRTEVEQQFLFVGDANVKNNLDRQQQAFIDSQSAILDQISAMKKRIESIKALLNEPKNIKTSEVRTHLKTFLTEYPLISSPTPDFYAQYLWALLREKTPRGHYLDSDNKELTRVLDLIFGNDAKGIKGLSTQQKSVIMYAFNKERQNASSSQTERNVVARWNIVNNYLAPKGINLEASLNVPSKKVMTIAETAYNAAKLSATEWMMIIEASGKKDQLKPFISGNKAKKQAILDNPQRLITVAMQLPISLYSSPEQPLNKSQQQKALSIWTELAQAINNSDPSGALLVNFVTQTLMTNLGISQFSKKDHDVIQKIVQTYLGIETYTPNSFPLPFMPQSTVAGRFDALSNHLSLMLTTLSTPSIKSSFETGIVRLMSQDTAEKEVGSSKYIIRLSNRNPEQLVVTYHKGIDYIHYYLSSSSKQTITLAGKSFDIGQYLDTELKDKVEPLVMGKDSIVPDFTLEQMTSKVRQRKQQAEFTEAASNYYPLSWNQEKKGFSGVQIDNAQGHREAIKEVQAILGETETETHKVVEPQPQRSPTVQQNKNPFFASANMRTDNSENKAIVKTLRDLTLNYLSDLKESNPLKSSITPILNELLAALNKKGQNNKDKIINFYTILDQKKIPTSLSNINIIAQDKQNSAQRFTAGVLTCIATVLTLFIPVLLFGLNPLDLFKPIDNKYQSKFDAIQKQVFGDDSTEQTRPRASC